MRSSRIAIRCLPVMLSVVATFGIAPRTACAQPENIFNIQFGNIPLRTENFSGFRFQTPPFATQSAAPIPFQNIQFRGLNGPVEPGRRRDVRDSLTAPINFRFAWRPRPVVSSRAQQGRSGIPNVRLARRTPFGPVSPLRYDAPRLARTETSRSLRIADRRTRNTIPTRLQIAAERRPFAPVSRH